MNRRFSAVREGLPLVVAIEVVAALSAMVSLWLGACLGLAGVCVLLFFRDPPRATPQVNDVLLAPADGRVVEVRVPANSDQSGRIAVFMSLFDIHVVRSPCDGIVREVRHVAGRYRHASSPAAALMNEHVQVELEHDGLTVTMRMIAGMVARRIVCAVEPGDTVQAGDRMGMIRFGSRVEVALPPGWRARVTERDRVRSGVTVIGAKV